MLTMKNIGRFLTAADLRQILGSQKLEDNLLEAQ